MRSLIGILAVVSVILAYVLERLELYIAAGTLVVAVLLSWIISLIRTRASAKKTQVALADDSSEDLETLGILSIKEKKPSVLRPSTQPAATESPSEAVTKTADTEAKSLVTEPDAPSVPANRTTFGALPDVYDTNVLLPILEGFHAALGAHAVCVLRENEDRYEVLGTAGQNFAKRAGESFNAPVPLLPASHSFAVRIVIDDIPSRSLGYSYTPGSVLRVAVARIGKTPLVLLADTTLELGLTHPRTRELLEQCANMLRVLFYQEDPDRPRHEIIAEEMALARAKNQGLALAIVVLRNNEPVAELGAGVIAEAELQLKERLEGILPESRVIRFGELAFGVFINGQRSTVEAWYYKVQASMSNNNGLLSGGVIVGIALLSDQHREADDLREAAKDALLSAYEQRVGAVISEPEDQTY